MKPRLIVLLVIGCGLAIGAVVLERWYMRSWDSPSMDKGPAAPIRATAVQNQAEEDSPAEAERKLIEQLDGPRRQRWTMLPAWVSRIVQGPDKRIWFVRRFSGSGTIELRDVEFKQSVEDAAAGKSQVIHGDLLLIDAAGRFWGAGLALGNLEHLWGYNGKEWRDIQSPRRAPVPVQTDRPARGMPFTPPPMPDPIPQLTPEQISSDSAGNLWAVLANKASRWIVTRYAPDGTIAPFPVAPGFVQPVGTYDVAPHIVERPRGVINLVPGRININPIRYFTGSVLKQELNAAPGVYRLAANNAFAHITPALNPSSPTNCIIALGDGNIASIAVNEQFRLHPQLTDDQLGKILDRLDDDDPDVRVAATQQLLQVDPQWAVKLAQAAQNEARPEVQTRLATVVDQLHKVQANGNFNGPALFDQRYSFATAKLISTGGEGAFAQARDTVLSVTDLTDKQTGREYDNAVVRISPQGKWRALPLPTDWDDGWIDSSKDSFEDAAGRIWLNSGVRIEADGKVTWPLPPGFTFESIAAQDERGRIYFRSNNRIYVLDESIPQTAAPLPQELERLNWNAARAGDGSIWAWRQTDGGEPRLQRFQGGQWKPVSGAPPGRGLDLIPLNRGAMIVTMARAADHAALFDNGQWRTAINLDLLIQEQQERLKQLLPAQFTDSHHIHLARDSSGNIWRIQDASNGSEFINCWDGIQWHDIWKDAQQLISSNVSLANPVMNYDGHGLAVQAGPVPVVFSIANHNIKVRQSNGEEVPKVPPSISQSRRNAQNDRESPGRASGNPVLVSANDYWMGGMNLMWHFHDGQADPVEVNGIPIFCLSGGTLIYKTPGGEYGINPNSDSPAAALRITDDKSDVKFAQSLDKRVWAVSVNELAELRISLDNPPVLQSARQWHWDHPLTHITDVFCDDTNGLWIGVGSSELIRVTLPPAQQGK